MRCTSDREDAECVRRVREGDTGAFEELVLRYQKPVFNAVCRMVHDAEDAREIAQNVFLKAFASLERFDVERSFFSWLYRIAMNDSINFVAARHPAEPLSDTERSTAAGPEQHYEATETRRHIDDALKQLTPEYRAVVVMRHFLDCSYQEIAEALGIPEKTVKSRLFSARQILRERLAAHGHGDRRARYA